MIPEAYQSIHQLEQNHWWYIGARAVYRTLLKIGLGPPDGQRKMLEVGVGTGGNLELLAEYGPTGGIDFSPLALERISEPPQLGLCQASAEALPFLSGTFDGVALLGLIEHLLDPSVDLAWLDAKFVRQIGDRYFVGQMPPHDLGLFLYAEAFALIAAHGILLRWALC